MTEISKPFRLDPIAVVPDGTPLVTDDDPNRYWLLSNGRAWTLALGQNIRNILPEVYAAPSGILLSVFTTDARPRYVQMTGAS